MFFESVKEFLKAKWIPIVGVLLGIIVGMLLLPLATVVVRNYQTQAPSDAATEEAGLVKRLKIFFSKESYEDMLAQQRKERLGKLREEEQAALKGIEEAMAQTVETLAKKPVQPAGPVVITPTLIVPEYMKEPQPTAPQP